MNAMLSGRMKVLKAGIARRYGGASDYRWDESGQEYACDVQPVSATKRVTLLAMDVDTTHVVYFDAARLTLSEKDRIKVGSQVFEVKTLEQPISQRSGWPAKAFVMETKI